jgi:hypothetical protein
VSEEQQNVQAEKSIYSWSDLIFFGVMWFLCGLQVAVMAIVGYGILQWGMRMLNATEDTAEAVKEPEAEAGPDPEREEWKR